jgi:Fe-S-cluster formation regulator IscX/YfhJ
MQPSDLLHVSCVNPGGWGVMTPPDFEMDESRSNERVMESNQGIHLEGE